MSAFEFLRLPERSRKPRTTGLTAMNDFGLSLSEIESVIEIAGEVIDFAKYKDHAGEIYRYSREYLVAKNTLYRKHCVRTYMGGAPFEVAYLQGKVDPYLTRVQELGFDYVKMSNYDMPELPRAERTRLIGKASPGIGVITVILRITQESPAAPVKWAIDEALADLDAGASFVTLDNKEARLWREHEPKALSLFAEKIGLDRILFEAGVGVEPAWFMNELGVQVNLENINVVYPNGATNIEMIRRGLHRDVKFRFIREEKARVAE